MTELRVVTRALLSVSDKSGLIEFARALADAGIELVSTGGTRKALADAGLKVRDVSELTGFPEMMDGRVKTLHPGVHGGLLAIRDNKEHAASMQAHGIRPIDLLVVNLYPFEATVAKGADFATCIENIDIGGPAMIRAAAKNHGDVAVVVDVGDYAAVLAELKANGGATTLAFRQKLAAKAYARTAVYDAAISNWFAQQLAEPAPTYRAFGGQLAEALRYGENPHQAAAFYRAPDSAPASRPRGSCRASSSPTTTSTTPTRPMNASASSTPAAPPPASSSSMPIRAASPRARACSTPTARPWPAIRCRRSAASWRSTGRSMPKRRAPSRRFSPRSSSRPTPARRRSPSSAAKKNLRLLLAGGLPDPRAGGLMVKSVAGGLLVQSRDNAVVDDMELKVVTKRAPTNAELRDLAFAFRIAKHVKSNTIVYAKDCATVGIGAGQMSRVDSARIAARKAEDAAKEAGLARAADQGLGGRLGCVLPVRRRPAGRDRGRRHRGDPARRLGARQRGDQGRRRPRHRHGVHRHPPLPALIA